MKLKTLLKNIPDLLVKGSKEIDITGLTENSGLVAPGNLFVAKKGKSQDGSKFIQDAILAGASCILTDLFDPFLTGVTQLIHSDVAYIETELAKAFYHAADKKLFLVGITGTNGKTTISYLTRHLLEGLKCSTGLIGTIEWVVGDHVFPATHTTPGIITNYKLFNEMSVSCKACVMEVSSHALDQNRVQGIEFDVAVFTNLTQDHLDYHASMEEYAEAKAKLFSSLLPNAEAEKAFPKVAVVNNDSEWTPVMTQNCRVPVLTYGIDAPADLKAEKITLSTHGMEFTLHYLGKEYLVQSSLIGRFNVYNILAATCVLLSYGATLDKILPLLKTFTKVQGRLERIPNQKNLNVFVDYAHTDDALFNVLNVVREITPGKIITVFGCGGNRDFLKRPKMAQVAEALSDVVIVTNDNPRSEDPEEIARQISLGFQTPERAQIILDRRAAIAAAIALATPQDSVLIAGKGHETYQIFPTQTLHFDDRQEVSALVALL